MNKKQAKNLIKEHVHNELNKFNLTEGIIDKIVDYVIQRLIRKKYGKVIDDIKNDPDFIEAQLALNRAVEEFDRSTKRAAEAEKEMESSKIEYKKKFGKNPKHLTLKGVYIV